MQPEREKKVRFFQLLIKLARMIETNDKSEVVACAII